MSKVPPSPFLRGNVGDSWAPPRPTGVRVAGKLTRTLLSYRKGDYDAELAKFRRKLGDFSDDEMDGIGVWYNPGPPELVLIDVMDWGDPEVGKRIGKLAAHAVGDESRVVWQNEGSTPDKDAGWVDLTSDKEQSGKGHKTLDEQGGEVPTIQADALRLADFITLPEKVSGTNCSSCSFEKGGTCRHPKLTGQKVNEKNCCAYWTAPGTLRDWKALHKFSSTQFNLDGAGYNRTQGPPAQKVLELAASIADDDLAEDGREDTPHVTVKYGLHTSSPEDVKKVLQDWLRTRQGLPGGLSVHARLGKTSLFPSKEGSPFDVVKLEVDSDDLRSLHQFLSGRLEHTDTHPVYNPHVTLAYVKPGLGKKYVGTGLAGHEVILHRLVFSDQQGKKTVIDLHQLGRQGTKALSSFGETTGGALLSPPRLKRKGGFSGRQTDSLGRTICYQNGHRVPCGGQSSSNVKPRGRPATTETEAARQQRTAEVKEAVQAAVLQAAGKAGHAVLSSRQAAQDVARRVGAATWTNLPETAQNVLALTWRGAKALEHVAMTAFRKGREVALEVAKEKGLPPDRAERLAKMLATTDMVLAWTVNMPAAYALTGSMGVAKVSSWLPAASLCYLAYSTVANPFRTMKAAKRALAQGGHKSLEAYDRREIASRLADLLKTASDPDWVLALYCAALDDTKDAADAVAKVEGVLRRDGIKSLADFMVKGVVRKTDSLGRHICLEDTTGRRVPCAPSIPSSRLRAGSGASAAPRPSESADSTADRPTKPSEREEGVEVPKKDYQPPPPPKGKVGQGKAGGFSSTGKTNTLVGDEIEELLAGTGFRSITPVVNGKKIRQNPLDVEWDHSGYAFEVKTCTTAAQEYKAKPKAKEVEEKKAYAEKHNLKPGIIIAVADYDAGETHFYWRLGVGAFALNPATGDKHWNYFGTVKMGGK